MVDDPRMPTWRGGEKMPSMPAQEKQLVSCGPALLPLPRAMLFFSIGKRAEQTGEESVVCSGEAGKRVGSDGCQRNKRVRYTDRT